MSFLPVLEDTLSTQFIAGLRRGEMAADHFTIVANSVARDPLVSFAAKGLFLALASHKDGFRITEEFLASQATDGVKKVRTLLLELRERGYVYRSQERTRYPAGTRNAAGKDISGALGPYTWFVTDKPDEIAVILERYATEQHARNLSISAVQDNVPDGHLVTTGGDAALAEQLALPTERAGSADQREDTIGAGGDNRPITTGGLGRSKEDHHKKTKQEDQAGCTLPPDPLRTDTNGSAARIGLKTEGDLVTDHVATPAENVSTDRARELPIGQGDVTSTNEPMTRDDAQASIARVLSEKGQPRRGRPASGTRQRRTRGSSPRSAA